MKGDRLLWGEWQGREPVLDVAASTDENSLRTHIQGSKENHSYFQDFSTMQKTRQIEQFRGFQGLAKMMHHEEFCKDCARLMGKTYIDSLRRLFIRHVHIHRFSTGRRAGRSDAISQCRSQGSADIGSLSVVEELAVHTRGSELLFSRLYLFDRKCGDSRSQVWRDVSRIPHVRPADGHGSKP
jgi:hypothetical protein